jgi:MOSC domain-containing protein YiiM
MTTRPQPEGLDRELDILRHTIRFHDNTVGLRAWVVRAGTVRVGDEVHLVD